MLKPQRAEYIANRPSQAGAGRHADSTIPLHDGDVRVSAWTLPPGASTGPRRRECSTLLVPLSPGAIEQRRAGDEVVRSVLAPGSVLRDDDPRDLDIRNPGPGAVTFLEIELAHTASRLISA